MKRLRLDTEDFIVVELPKQEVADFIQKYHYSPVFPKLTKHWLGIYNNKDVLVGAMTLGWGTQPKQTIKKLFPDLDTQDYLEIGKMCMSDDMPRNSETQMLRSVVQWLKIHRPDVSLLYTMADGIMGKVGYVYQAFNFKYGGSYYTDVYMTNTGEKVHPRSTRELLVENAEFVGKDKLFWMTHDFLEHKGMQRIKGLMFRYMYPLNKKGKWILKKSDWSIDYPKDKDLMWKKQVGPGKYDIIEKPSFTFDNAIINKRNIQQFK
jgi:hypothetical protein